MTADYDFPDSEPDLDFDGTDDDVIDGMDDDVIVPEEDGERIAKALARAGVCSRRDAEKLIADRRVKVNGQVVETPATLVTVQDMLTVDGKPVAKPQTTRVWRYHKPPGLVTTHHDPQGRATVFDAMPSTMPRVISVGRLDLNSEGLLLLTNDGALARQFEHPSNGWTRRYRVRVFGAVDPARLALLAKGVTVEGVTYGAIQAEVERQSGANSWLTVTLTEGKNREIRRVMDYLGYRVNRLVRVSYGPFYIGRLERGELEEIPPKMLAELLDNVAKAGSVGDVKPVRLDRTGWARAKPKPVRPGSRRLDFAAKAEDRRFEDGPKRDRTERFSAKPGRPRPEGEENRGAARREFQQDRNRQDGAGQRSDRPFSGRPQGDRPRQDRDGDRPFGARRPDREGQQDRPRNDRFDGGPSRGDRPYHGRPQADRAEGDRPRGDRPYGDKPQGDRPRSDRPRGDRPYGDKPQGDRPRSDRPRGDRPYGDKPQGDRPRSDRPRDDRPYGDKPQGDRPRSDRPRGDRPYGDKPQGDRPRSDRPRGDRPYGDKPQGDRPRSDRPRGDRPYGDKSQGDRPHSDRPRGNRPDGNRSGRGHAGGGSSGGGRPGGSRSRSGGR